MEPEQQVAGLAPFAVRRDPVLRSMAVDLVVATLVVLAVPALAGTPIALGPALAVATAWCVALAVAGAWTATTRRAGARSVLQAGAAAAVAAWAVDALFIPVLTPAAQVAAVGALVLAATVPQVLRRAPRLRVAVAGDLADVTPLLAELRRDRARRWDVASVCVDLPDPGALATASDLDACSGQVWVGSDAVVDAAFATGAQAVVVAPGCSLDPPAVRRLCWTAHEAGLEVYVGTGLLDTVPSRVEHVSAGLAGLARVRPRTGPSTARVLKDVTDRALAALALLVFLPILLVVAVAIRWDSPGNALYAQRRTGRSGGMFTMYKFRTMRTDADQLRGELVARNDCDGVLFKMHDDPRITRVGRILRRYSLDELPQLINVVRGEMSLVGPRPALPAEVARYERDPRHRLAVKPGLTGLWQVSGRSDLSWDDTVRLDLHYVDNWSWSLDLHILARTVGAVLGHRGAY